MVDFEWIALGIFVASAACLLFDERWERYKARRRARIGTPTQRAKKRIAELTEGQQDPPQEITQVWVRYDENNKDNGV